MTITLALPLIPLPGTSPRKNGEKGLVATLASPSPRMRGEGKGEGQSARPSGGAA
jgi:hypothetical protein